MEEGPRQAQEVGKPGDVYTERPTVAGQSSQLRERSVEPTEGNRGARLGWKKQLCRAVRSELGKKAFNLPKRRSQRWWGQASSSWGRQGDGQWVSWGLQVHVRARA